MGVEYDEKIDIWDIGMMTYECLLGKIPFRIYSELDLNRIVIIGWFVGWRWDKIPGVHWHEWVGKRLYSAYNEEEALGEDGDKGHVTASIYYKI